MDKKTLMAILLSTIVVIASFIIQPILFKNSYNSDESAQNAASEQNLEATSENSVSEEQINKAIISDVGANASIEEKTFEFDTKKAKIVLTNKGGDLISYNLSDHIDTDTKVGVQLVDNVSEKNRALSVGFGAVDSPIINDLFNYEQIDENTILFTKRFSIKNDDGSEKSFVLGKKYSFMPNEYLFKLDILIHGDDENSLIKVNDVGYTLRTSPQIGPYFNAKLNRYENRQFISFNGNKAKRTIISGKNNQLKSYDKDYIWNGIAGKYFAEIAVPLVPENFSYSWYSTKVEVNDYANAQAIMVRKPISVQDVKDSFYFYFGPRNEKDLKVYNVAENNGWKVDGLKLTESLQSSGWLGWLETILKWFLEFINRFVRNWGVSIIVMTLIIKVILFPLTKNQSMSSLKMQKIQPKVQALQAKYKDNPQKQQEEMAKIYKEAGYNPMSGCLPMLVQFLLLWSMFNIFNNYFEFRGASFIPGWISDLSAGDSLYTLKKSIPFFGNQVRILPFIYLGIQLLSGKITGGMAGTGTPATAQTQTQMKMMMYGMPILFFFMFYNASSGLLLYWTSSTIFQIIQQLIINTMMRKKRDEMTKTAVVKSGKNVKRSR
ncbi:MAG: membrane protein insertase YidC [Treponema sp.]